MKSLTDTILEKLQISRNLHNSIEDIIKNNKVLKIISTFGGIHVPDGIFDDETDPELKCTEVLNKLAEWIYKNNVNDVDIFYDKNMVDFRESEGYFNGDILTAKNTFNKNIKFVDKITAMSVNDTEIYESNDGYISISVNKGGCIWHSTYVGSILFKVK